MGRKKRKPLREGRPGAAPGKIPDRRAMEGMMQQVVAGLRGEATPDTPLGKANVFGRTDAICTRPPLK